MERLKIEKFRGIREGEIKDFGRINIFVGKNNTGKSTILEAIYLISTLAKEDIFGNSPLYHIITKRGSMPDLYSVRYLFNKGKENSFSIENEKHKMAVMGDQPSDMEETKYIKNVNPEFDFEKEDVLITKLDGIPLYKEYVDKDLHYQRFILNQNQDSRIEVSSIFIDPFEISKYGIGENVYKSLVELGGKEGKKKVIDILKKVFKEVEELEIVDNLLRIFYKNYSVPIYVMGDGFRVALPIICLSSIVDKGTILIEEPESHQHPGSLELVIRNIIESSKTNQIFISTHSIEFLKKIVDMADKENCDLKIYRTYLKNEKLEYITYSCKEALEQMEKIKADLR